jgi:cysteine desulfurase
MVNIANMMRLSPVKLINQMEKNKIDPVYLDNNATTPCDPKVVEIMLPFFSEFYGNPSNGLHWQGRKSKKAIDESREKVAQIIGSNANEIFFTSGATESINLSILGFSRANTNNNRKKIITTAIEHKAVLDSCKVLQDEGFVVTILPPSPNGLIQAETLEELIDEQTLIVSIQAANNETGTIQPINELADISHSYGAVFHCDAVQAIGKIPFNVSNSGLDFMSLSSHKIYGPKGVGALFIRGGKNIFDVSPLFWGGGQENGLRPGTSNTPGIVGFGEACNICKSLLENESKFIQTLRDSFELALQSKLESIVINSKNTLRLPNTSNVTFPGIDSDALILNAPGIMIGTGSACNSGAIEPSHVLTAMGISRDMANSSIRVSFGRFNNSDDPIIASNELLKAYNRLLSFR